MLSRNACDDSEMDLDQQLRITSLIVLWFDTYFHKRKKPTYLIVFFFLPPHQFVLWVKTRLIRLGGHFISVLILTLQVEYNASTVAHAEQALKSSIYDLSQRTDFQFSLNCLLAPGKPPLYAPENDQQ